MCGHPSRATQYVHLDGLKCRDRRGFRSLAVILAYRTHVIEARGFWIPRPFSSAMLDIMLDFSGGMLLGIAILVGGMLAVFGRLRKEIVVLCIWIVVSAAYRHRGIDPINSFFLVALCDRLSAAAPPGLRLWLDQVHE